MLYRVGQTLDLLRALLEQRFEPARTLSGAQIFSGLVQRRSDGARLFYGRALPGIGLALQAFRSGAGEFLGVPAQLFAQIARRFGWLLHI